MKLLVYVLVPYTVDRSQIVDIVDRAISPYQILHADRRYGWYDYLYQCNCVFDDKLTEWSLPARVQRQLQGRICDLSRLPLDRPLPDVVVTPDGIWHNCEDNTPDEVDRQTVGWYDRYYQLLDTNPHCWVVAIGAHS